MSLLALHARLNLALLDQQNLVGRTAEMARTYGIDFASVLIRGSQYRVESLLLRLAHSQNYVMVSPSKDQVGAVSYCMVQGSRFQGSRVPGSGFRVPGSGVPGFQGSRVPGL